MKPLRLSGMDCWKIRIEAKKIARIWPFYNFLLLFAGTLNKLPPQPVTDTMLVIKMGDFLEI